MNSLNLALLKLESALALLELELVLADRKLNASAEETKPLPRLDILSRELKSFLREFESAFAMRIPSGITRIAEPGPTTPVYTRELSTLLLFALCRLSTLRSPSFGRHAGVARRAKPGPTFRTRELTTLLLRRRKLRIGPENSRC